jgi:hypothetical protein
MLRSVARGFRQQTTPKNRIITIKNAILIKFSKYVKTAKA